jgi:predicted cupin superfamily sugar epimerase
MTSIYYLLEEGEFGRWHRVRSDEVWHLYEGGPLELLVAPPDLSVVEHRVLDVAGPDAAPVSVVAADWWQAARPLGDYVLAGCTVAPGFEFEDFAFLSDEPLAMERFNRLDPVYRALL